MVRQTITTKALKCYTRTSNIRPERQPTNTTMSDNTPTAPPATAKPEPAHPNKAPTKPKPTTSKAAPSAVLAIKTSPINPVWATEVAKAYCLAGPLAESVAEHLAKTVAERLEKITRPDRLKKLVKESIAECIDKIA